MLPSLIQQALAFEAASGAAADGLAQTLAGSLPAVAAELKAWLPAAGADAGKAFEAVAALHLKLGQPQALVDLADVVLALRAGAKADPALEGACLAAQGAAHLQLDQPREGFRKLNQAQQALAQAGLGTQEEAVLALLLDYARRYHKAADVLAPLTRRLDGCLAKGDRAGQARAMLQLGQLEDLQGHGPEMRQWLERSLELFHGLGQKQGAQDCLDLLADRALRAGDYPAAQRYSQDFLNLAQENVDRSGLVWSELRLAELEIFTGQLDHALSRLNKSLALIHPQRERWNWAYFTNKLGEGQRIAGRLDEAAKHSRAALDAFSGLGDAWGQAWAGDFLGYVLWRQGQRREGALLLEDGVRRHEARDARSSLGGCLTHLAEVLLLDQGPAAAWPALKKAIGYCLETAYASTESECLAVAAACLQAQGKALAGELALFLGGHPGSTYSCKETLRRLAVKPGSGLIMLADRPGRRMDLAGALKLVNTVAAA